MEADHVKVYKMINRLEMQGPYVRSPGQNFNTKVVLFPVVHNYAVPQDAMSQTQMVLKTD